MQRWKLNWSKTQCFLLLFPSCLSSQRGWLPRSILGIPKTTGQNEQGNAWLSITSCGRAVEFGNPGKRVFVGSHQFFLFFSLFGVRIHQLGSR